MIFEFSFKVKFGSHPIVHLELGSNHIIYRVHEATLYSRFTDFSLMSMLGYFNIR